MKKAGNRIAQEGVEKRKKEGKGLRTDTAKGHGPTSQIKKNRRKIPFSSIASSGRCQETKARRNARAKWPGEET